MAGIESEISATPFKAGRPSSPSASVASMETATSQAPSNASTTKSSIMKRRTTEMLKIAQEKGKQTAGQATQVAKKLPGQAAKVAKAAPGELKATALELKGQTTAVAGAAAKAASALPGQTKRAYSQTQAAYAQGKAATIHQIQSSNLPEGVKRAALAALIKQRESVQVPDLTGKVAIVTGGNVGIGLEVTKALALHGAKVIIAARSETRCQEALADVGTAIHEARVALAADESVGELPAPGDVEYMILDLASLRAIEQFVADYTSTGSPLHILVHCAGVYMPPNSFTEDGFEMQIGVNHVGSAYLTRSLMDLLKASSPSRVVFCGSSAAAQGKMTGNDLRLRLDKRSTTQKYATSRLFNCMFAEELRNRVAADGVDVLITHPGFTQSDLQQRLEKSKVSAKLQKMASKKPQPNDLGALSTIYAATNPEAKGQFGTWYGPDSANKHNTELRVIPNQLAHDPAWCKRLYDDTLAAVKYALEEQPPLPVEEPAAVASKENVPVSTTTTPVQASKSIKKTGTAKFSPETPALSAATPTKTTLNTVPISKSAAGIVAEENDDTIKAVRQGGMKKLASIKKTPSTKSTTSSPSFKQLAQEAAEAATQEDEEGLTSRRVVHEPHLKPSKVAKVASLKGPLSSPETPEKFKP